MNRSKYIQKISDCFAVNPAVAILGPRQCGKTTLANIYASDVAPKIFFDLENPLDLAKLEAPMLALEKLEGLIIIDEIQRRPELFPLLRVLIDKNRGKQQFLILGSASRDLIAQSSESLAGRISYVELTPFTLAETGAAERLFLRGGFPPSYLAEDVAKSNLWRKAYISTFLERDIPNLGINIAAPLLRRFWMMLANCHANIFNASEIGRSLNVSSTAVRHYLDILTGTFMIRELQPWFANIKKRQVKSPKIYFRDSGILHSLLNLETAEDLYNYPKLGALWEGFALEEVIRYNNADALDCFFWATHGEAELDLLITKGGKNIGFEFKYTDAPKITKSMHIALEDLQLDNLTVIFPGKDSFALAEKIQAVGLERYITHDSN